MKTIHLILLILVLTGTGVAQKQTTPPLRKPKQVLFDFRVALRSDPLKIPISVQRKVLSKIFRKYLTDEGKCNPQFDASRDTDPLKAARNAGQMVPSIIDVANGSFTAAARTETLYVISVNECNASHADNFGTKRVAIFAGSQLIADVDTDFKSSIVRKTDLNSDGRDELLMTSGYMNQGILIEMAALVEFQNGRVRVIEDFEKVTDDSCSSGIPGSSARASVVSFSEVVSGKIPRLRIDNYEASCRNAKRWRFLSTGKMPD